MAYAWGPTTNVTINEPLREQFKTTSTTISFLNATLLTIIIFLGILSAMLLYSLMLSDVEGKTYEYGMLRALGFKANHLIGLISLQSFSFAVPGIFIGIFVAFIINVGLREVIFIAADNYESYALTPISIAIGVCFGSIMPPLSNYLPIKSALNKNLRASLDLNRRAKDEVSITVKKLQDVGISTNQLVVSVMMIVGGVGVYYVVPLGIFKEKFTLVFILLNVLLILIIVGMTFICVLLF